MVNRGVKLAIFRIPRNPVLLLFLLQCLEAISIGPYPTLPADTGSQQLFTGEQEAIHMIGSGYNILKGNPDGSSWSTSGDDPGVLQTRTILSVDLGDSPQQINIRRRHGCKVSHNYNLVYNGKTYQQRLGQYVTESVGGYNNTWKEFAFTLSSDYNAISHQTETLNYVFQDYTTLCNIGDARYQLELAGNDGVSLTTGFVDDVCKLPSVYDARQYEIFIDKWGTHVVTEVFYGKRETKRYRVQINDFFNYLLQNVSADIREAGPMSGFASSLNVDMDSFQFREEYRHLIGLAHQEITIGGTDFYDNIQLVITPLTEVLKDELWIYVEANPSCRNTTTENIQTWNKLLSKAVSEYPARKHAVAPGDKSMAIPLTWPKGTYTLQKPISGCPGEITWAEGNRYEEPEKQDPDSTWSPGNHFAGVLSTLSFNIRFCTKDISTPTGYETDWGKGNYCIYQHGPCPTGFQSGSIYLNDDDTANKNSFGGVLPDGTYNSDTTYNYCCRSDGSVQVPIWLPSTEPFYLFRYKSGCQKVYGMTVSEENLYWDTEDTLSNSRCSGACPSPGSIYPYAVRLYYCYYSSSQGVINGPIIGK